MRVDLDGRDKLTDPRRGGCDVGPEAIGFEADVQPHEGVGEAIGG